LDKLSQGTGEENKERVLEQGLQALEHARYFFRVWANTQCSPIDSDKGMYQH